MIEPKHIQNLRRRLIADRGYLLFLALFERDEAPGTWDLLISGGGLRSNTLADYEYVGRLLNETLTLDEMLELTKFVVLREDYEPIQKLLKRVHVEDDEPVELENFRFYEFLIRRALIFHAAPAEVGAEKA
ncbi:MAG TPA: hypothetical protein VEO54_06440 [Thermoanaerobaculia bacterium]|nr:hypothetical protein [Thermoanaerobaculia bacterium]